MITALAFGLIGVAIILLSVARQQARDRKALEAVQEAIVLQIFKVQRLDKQVFSTTKVDPKEFSSWIHKCTPKGGR